MIYLLNDLHTGCGKYTSHILNCLMCDASVLRQVVLVAPSSSCLTNFFFSQIWSCLRLVHTMHLLSKYSRLVSLLFMLNSCWNDTVLDRKLILLLVENSIESVSSQHNMKWPPKKKNALCGSCRFTDLKKDFNSKCIVYTISSYDDNRSYQRKKMVRH